MITKEQNKILDEVDKLISNDSVFFHEYVKIREVDNFIEISTNGSKETWGEYPFYIPKLILEKSTPKSIYEMIKKNMKVVAKDYEEDMKHYSNEKEERT